jgi:hypothetical protein
MFRSLIEKWFSKFLFFFWLAVTSPPILLGAWFSNDQHELQANFGWLGCIGMLAWLLGSWWLGTTTSRYMFREKRMFLEAVKLTLCDLRFKLTYIRVRLLGAWFPPDEDKSKNDSDDA